MIHFGTRNIIILGKDDLYQPIIRRVLLIILYIYIISNLFYNFFLLTYLFIRSGNPWYAYFIHFYFYRKFFFCLFLRDSIWLFHFFARWFSLIFRHTLLCIFLFIFLSSHLFSKFSNTCIWSNFILYKIFIQSV